MRGLRRWNRSYGRDGEREVRGEGFAIGNFVEHFAEVFPAGTPVFEDGDLLYAIDAVIYNRDELDATDGESDEEIIISLIKEKGYSELKNVNGDFAGAVLNKETGKLKLFRDHLGVRPLYYYIKDGLLSFSTDIRGLGALPDADLQIDERQLWIHLAGYYDSTLDRTHFEYMRCVLPGSIIMFSEEGTSFAISTERYFMPGKKKVRLKNDEQYVARLRELIEDSIIRRLDVFPGRIGAELSGGLDSSVIDILINRIRPGGKYVAWRMVPDDWPMQPEDERLVIKDIVEQESLSFEYLPESDSFDYLEKKAVPVFSNTNQLSEVARLVSKDGIRVVFSGQGGDEGASHRSSILELYQAGEYNYYLRANWDRCSGANFKILRMIDSLIKQIYYYYFRLSKPQKIDNNALTILNKEYVKKMKKIKGYPDYYGINPKLSFEFGSVRLRPETAAYQAAEYGVRYVFPYEDYRVFDYALSIPRNLYLKDGVDRWIYRKTFEDIMPELLKKVFYKDYPSVRNENPYVTHELSALKKLIFDNLDTDRWRDYIDINAVEELEECDIPKEKNEVKRFISILEGLLLFVYFQNYLDFSK